MTISGTHSQPRLKNVFYKIWNFTGNVQTLGEWCALLRREVEGGLCTHHLSYILVLLWKDKNCKMLQMSLTIPPSAAVG